MLAVLASIVHQHSARLLALAALICLLSYYTALNLIARAGKPGNNTSDPWLTAAAAATGCGVWAVEFVALLAFKPYSSVGYDAGMALLAAAIGIVSSGLGLAGVVHRRAALGGAIVGAGIVAVNYVAMAAMRLPAREHWDSTFVVVSLLLSTGLGAASLAFAQRQQNWRGQLTAALLLTLGTLGAHFMSIAALSLTPDPTLAVPLGSVRPIWFSLAITAICILILGLGVIGALADQHIREIEAAKGELQQTTERLNAAIATAAAADRAKSHFFASMSHELRTPLNAILGFSAILKEPPRPLDADRIRDYAESIFASGDYLLALINDILDMSKIKAGRFELNEETLDLGAVVDSCVQSMSPQAEKAVIRLDVTMPDALPRVCADGRRLRQILLNLLANAIKFTPEGGRVHVGVGVDHDRLAVTVADTGIGMSAEQISIAFEYFGQIDSKLSRRHAGTGLGLPITKQLVELHGGALEIASEPGVGTTVTVVLPAERIIYGRNVA
jgi:signal transduction histidine kinase